jgi:hypothetical protein
MTLKEVLKKFEKLSEEKKRFLSSPVVLAHIEEIESRYNVKLALVLMEIVVGKKDDDFTDFLVSKLHLGKNKASEIFSEIREKVLNELNELDKKPTKKEVNKSRSEEEVKVNFIDSEKTPIIRKSAIKSKKEADESFTKKIEKKQEVQKIKKIDILAPPPPMPIVKKIKPVVTTVSKPYLQQKNNFTEVKKKKTVQNQIDSFDKSDEEEIKKIQNNAQVSESIESKVNWNKEAELIVKNLNINIGGDLNIKLINILSSTLRGVRSTFDSMDMLKRRTEDGGIGLEVNLIDSILGAIKHRKKMINDIHSGVKFPSHIFVLSGDGEPMVKKERSNSKQVISPVLGSTFKRDKVKQNTVISSLPVPVIKDNKKEEMKQQKIITPPTFIDNKGGLNKIDEGGKKKSAPKLEPANSKKDMELRSDREKLDSFPPVALLKEDIKKKKKKSFFGFLFSKKKKKKIKEGKKISTMPSANVVKNTLTPPPGVVLAPVKGGAGKIEEINKEKIVTQEISKEKKKRMEKNKEEMEEILNKTIDKVLSENKNNVSKKQPSDNIKEIIPIKKEEVKTPISNVPIDRENKIKNFREKVPLIPNNNVIPSKKDLVAPIKEAINVPSKGETKDEKDNNKIEKINKEIKSKPFFGLFSKKKKAKKPINKKVKIEDIKKVDMSAYEGNDKHRLIGPIEELEGLSLKDFRNLSNDPVIATNKIEEKINNLEIDSLARRILGIKAWKKCEINQAYLLILNEAMMKNTSFENIIEERKRARIATIDANDFYAIGELSKKLRF